MKKILILLALLLVIPLVSATYQAGDIEFRYETNATPCYVSIDYPNSTLAVDNGTMTDQTGYANYTFTSKVIGEYEYFVECNGASNSGSFEVTTTGSPITQSRAIIYIGMLGILIFLFVTIILAINKLPKGKVGVNEKGFMSINYLKYLRSALWFVEYFMLIAITYVCSNLGYAYLGEEMFADLFFAFYTILFTIAPVVVIIWFGSIIAMIFKDRELWRNMKRGLGTGSV